MLLFSTNQTEALIGVGVLVYLLVPLVGGAAILSALWLLSTTLYWYFSRPTPPESQQRTKQSKRTDENRPDHPS